MVAVGGNSGGNRAAENFSGIELVVARVGPGDHNPAYGVTSAAPKASFTDLKVTGVLTKHRRQDGRSPESLDGPVGPCGTIAFPITCGSLAITRFAIFGLADACQKAVPGIQRIVKRTAGDDGEFLRGGQRRYRAGVLDGQKIWQDKAQAICGCTSNPRIFVLIRVCRLFGTCRLVRRRRLRRA